MPPYKALTIDDVGFVMREEESRWAVKININCTQWTNDLLGKRDTCIMSNEKYG